MKLTTFSPQADRMAKSVAPVTEKAPCTGWRSTENLSDMPLKPALKHIQGRPENEGVELTKKTVRFAPLPLETDDAESMKSVPETASNQSSPEASLSSEPSEALSRFFRLRDGVPRRRPLPVACPSVPLRPVRPAPPRPSPRVAAFGAQMASRSAKGPQVENVSLKIDRSVGVVDHEEKKARLENDIQTNSLRLVNLKQTKAERRGSNPFTRLIYFFTRYAERAKINADIKLIQKQLDADEKALEQINLVQEAVSIGERLRVRP